MKRNALQDLVTWNNSKNRKPLIVWGARQTGKTYLIKELFAKKYFPNSYVYIDLRLEDGIREYCSQTVNPKQIIDYIELSKQTKINANTLLIFDEVQECPGIITSLKYFCQDYSDIPVIATGSMVRIKLKRINNDKKNINQFLFPVGKINQLTLYPMTFDEYLQNVNEPLLNKIKESYQIQQPLEQSVHELALNYVYKFMLIGGMPEALDYFIKTDDYLGAREILTDLYDNYLSDMQLYQISNETIIRTQHVYQNIHAQLNKNSKNFKVSQIESGKRNRDFQNAIDWLTMSHVVYKAQHLQDHITFPLTEKNEGLYRLYLADIGMFSYQSGLDGTQFLSNDANNTLSGIFFENYFACELIAKGNKLFYWTAKTNAEFEFVSQVVNYAIPMDVKKGRGVLNSLEKFKQYNSLKIAIKISKNNLGYDPKNKILTVPLYDAFLVAENIKSNIINNTSSF